MFLESSWDHEWLDSIQTSIKLTMDWASFSEAGYDSSMTLAIAGLDMEETAWGSYVNPSMLQFQHPNYLTLRKGQQLQANVEAFYVTTRRPVFLDVFGFTWNHQVSTYHPITSVTPLQSATPMNNNMSSVIFNPSFGFQRQHWLEEYREFTVVKGLGSTGGLVGIF
ncbi:hypothetical protein FRB95_013330 [Tulasnella sp. JGI-2019a]|nr:hypothetical protein FRB95_013330 [Tulasnella sp. JGI-2019a]